MKIARTTWGALAGLVLLGGLGCAAQMETVERVAQGPRAEALL